MSFSTLFTEIDGPSYVITLNRPERRNAISVKTLDELMMAVGEAEELATVAGVILTGGAEYFSSGADLNDAAAIGTRSEGLAYFGRWHRMNDTLESLSKPVIAAIEGYCITGGCELALACDLRVAGAGASFAITSSRIGTVAGAGGTQRLPRLIGSAKALEIMFSAEPIDAREAHRIGLVNRLVDQGQALSEAKSMMKVYAERAPLSLAWCKRAVHRGMQMDLAAGLEFETFLVSTIYATNDRKEGIAAFLEKRAPQFKGN